MDLNNINEDWKKSAPNLAAMEAANPFTVPENYFKDSRAQISARINIEILAANDNEGAFSIPENYFEELPDQINAKIRLEDLKQQDIFKVPKSYFENLTSNIQSRIQIEEVLNLDSESSQFAVPEGYFDKSKEKILNQTVHLNENKVVPINRSKYNWIKYAAAACITTIIGTSVYFNNYHSQQSDIESAMSKIPDAAIVNYLQVNSSIDDADMILEHLSDQAIQPAIQSEFSEKEIESYLETSL